MLNFPLIPVILIIVLVFITTYLLTNKSLKWALLLSYIPLLLAIIIFPFYYDISLIKSKQAEQFVYFNLYPFKQMIRFYQSDILLFVKNIVGNFCLLMPLALLLLLFKVEPKKAVIIIVFTSLAIEILQLAKNLLYQFNANYPDIDDFILNVTGALAFFFLFKIVNKHNNNKLYCL